MTALAAGLAIAGPLFAAPLLTVERLHGTAHVDHRGQTIRLKPGDALHDRDVLRLDNDAELSLRFAQDSLLELGPGAALAIERLPESIDQSDLRSIFSLWEGYLHISWKHPPDRRWPLSVYSGSERSSLVDGDYFFERSGAHSRSCVAAGRLEMTSIADSQIATLQPSACYEMPPGGALKTEPRTQNSWLAVRRAFTLNPASAETAPAGAALVADPPAPAAAPGPRDDAGWMIQIGAYADPQNAERARAAVAAAGATPVLRIKTVDGRTWNSVQIRGFASREAAQAELLRLGTALALPGLLVLPEQQAD